MAHTHSCGVLSMGTPSDVSTAQPPTPPTSTSAPSIVTDNADIPGNYYRTFQKLSSKSG